jgi:hypothetical protein
MLIAQSLKGEAVYIGMPDGCVVAGYKDTPGFTQILSNRGPDRPWGNDVNRSHARRLFRKLTGMTPEQAHSKLRPLHMTAVAA